VNIDKGPLHHPSADLWQSDVLMPTAFAAAAAAAAESVPILQAVFNQTLNLNFSSSREMYSSTDEIGEDADPIKLGNTAAAASIAYMLNDGWKWVPPAGSAEVRDPACRLSVQSSKALSLLHKLCVMGLDHN
jgi:hypothetical protein